MLHSLHSWVSRMDLQWSSLLVFLLPHQLQSAKYLFCRMSSRLTLPIWQSENILYSQHTWTLPMEWWSHLNLECYLGMKIRRTGKNFGVLSRVYTQLWISHQRPSSQIRTRDAWITLGNPSWGGQFHCSFHCRQNIKKKFGGGEGITPLTCLWMFNILVKCNSVIAVHFLHSKNENQMKPAHLAYPNSVPNNEQLPAAHCSMAIELSGNICIYSRSASSGVKLMNQRNKTLGCKQQLTS